MAIPSSHTYDAIVVGSGISGGWAAKELTERGLKVLLLDRGQNVEHIKDYKNALKQPWEVPHRGRATNAFREAHPGAQLRWRSPGLNDEWWADEAKNPYVETKPFDWIRGYQVGGRSLIWGRQSYRWSDLDFEANARDGLGVDWPVRYADLAPWYDHVERFAGISGNRDGIPQLPDGEFMPPMKMNCVEEHVATRLDAHYGGTRRLIIARTANLTQSIQDRAPCQFRAKCHLGCPFGGYFSTQSSTLPAAVKTGNLTLRPQSIATRVLYDADRRRARGVEVLDAETHQTIEFGARLVFLCASALNSAWLLMRSATEIWPGGLGSSSGELGHNIMDHQLGAGASGRAEGFEDRTVFGRRPNGIYLPRYRNLKGNEGRGYLRGFGFQGGANRSSWQRDVAELAIGVELKESLLEPGDWSMGLGGFGEILPDHANRISLDPKRTDAWGLPVLAMDCRLTDNDRAMRREIISDATEMLEAAGVKDIKPRDSHYNFGNGIHEMGSARMGRDPKTSVLNAHNQVWDAPNVLVTDGACMTSASCVNPSLTYMAFTARAAAFAVDEVNRGNL